MFRARRQHARLYARYHCYAVRRDARRATLTRHDCAVWRARREASAPRYRALIDIDYAALSDVSDDAV